MNKERNTHTTSSVPGVPVESVDPGSHVAEWQPFEPLTFEDYEAARAVLKDVALGYENGDPHLVAEFDAEHHKGEMLCGCNPDWFTVESWSSPDSYSFCGHHTNNDRWQAFVIGVRAATRAEHADGNSTSDSHAAANADAITTSESDPEKEGR